MRAAGPITTCRPAVTITPTTMSATASAAITSAAAAAATSFTASSASPPWKYGPDGTKRGPNASKMAKHRKVKPAVDKILNAGGVESQAAVLRAVADHPALTVARLLAGIDSSKSMNATKFLCEQSSHMLSRTRSTTGGKSTNEKRDAAETILVSLAPSPGTKNAPSICARASILGIARTTLKRREKQLIDKRGKLTAGELGVCWAVAGIRVTQKSATR